MFIGARKPGLPVQQDEVVYGPEVLYLEINIPRVIVEPLRSTVSSFKMIR